MVQSRYSGASTPYTSRMMEMRFSWSVKQKFSFADFFEDQMPSMDHMRMFSLGMS